jgi:hypothetical protein
VINFFTQRSGLHLAFASTIHFSVNSYARVALEYAQTIPVGYRSILIEGLFRRPVDLTTPLSPYMSACLKRMEKKKKPIISTHSFSATVWDCLIRAIEHLIAEVPKERKQRSERMLLNASFSKGFDLMSPIPEMCHPKRMRKTFTQALAIVKSVRLYRKGLHAVLYLHCQLTVSSMLVTSSVVRRVLSRPLFEPRLSLLLLAYTGYVKVASKKRQREESDH